MSRKHFNLIAMAIRTNIPDRALREVLAQSLLSALEACTPRFSAPRFIEAAVGTES